MTAATRHARQAAALVSREGEPVILPTGTVTGVVDLYAEESQRRSRAPGAAPLGAPQTPRPIVYVLAADAESLQPRAEVTIRGVVYLTVAKDAEDGGLVRVELMRKPADADQTQYDRWQ